MYTNIFDVIPNAIGPHGHGQVKVGNALVRAIAKGRVNPMNYAKQLGAARKVGLAPGTKTMGAKLNGKMGQPAMLDEATGAFKVPENTLRASKDQIIGAQRGQAAERLAGKPTMNPALDGQANRASNLAALKRQRTPPKPIQGAVGTPENMALYNADRMATDTANDVLKKTQARGARTGASPAGSPMAASSDSFYGAGQGGLNRGRSSVGMDAPGTPAKVGLGMQPQGLSVNRKIYGG